MYSTVFSNQPYCWLSHVHSYLPVTTYKCTCWYISLQVVNQKEEHAPKMMNKILKNRRGLLSVIGAFLINLATGIYNGTFGNILPYLTSYMRQVSLASMEPIEITIMTRSR